MRAVLQRVSRASVEVDGEVVGALDKPGLLVLFGVEHGDCDLDCSYLAKRIVEMRIFSDADGKMNRSLIDVGGGLLAVSQFTLFADWQQGRRPGFTKAAPSVEANRLYEVFMEQVRALGVHVEKGMFGTHMNVSLVNDGPVTLILDYQKNRA